MFTHPTGMLAGSVYDIVISIWVRRQNTHCMAVIQDSSGVRHKRGTGFRRVVIYEVCIPILGNETLVRSFSTLCSSSWELRER